MTFTIPTWLLWLIGVPALLLILILAGFGVWFLWTFRNWRPFG